MIKKTLEDGTVLIAFYDDGFYLHVYCACTGVDEDAEPSVYLNPTDSEQCPNCGKRYETMMIPTVEFSVNGSYETKF